MAKRTTKRAPAKRAPARRREREPEPDRERERAPERERGEDRGGDRDYGRRSSRGRGSSDLTRMGGLWKKKTRKGDPMLSGLVNVGEFLDYIEQHGLKAEDRAPLLVLVNNYKKEERHPDFNLFGVDPASRQRRGNGGGRGRDDRDNRGGGGGRGGNRDYGRDSGRRYERENDDPFGGESNSLD